MSRSARIFERQGLHAASLVLLIAASRASQAEPFRQGSLWGLGSVEWAWLAVGVAIAHQVLVWFCWRTELHAHLLSRIFGTAGFTLYAVLFSIIGLARTTAVWLLAIANQTTFDVAVSIQRPLAIVLLVPALYLFYSVGRYFGFRRAFGADHFDASYRDIELVDQGIFRWTDNGMYTFGFLILWVPALWWGSVAALWVALFNHLYIWVHFFATEQPDMDRIYGPEG